MEKEGPTKKRLGITGVIVGFLALSGAFLSPWIQDAIDPPGKSLEESAFDLADRIAAVAKARAAGEEYISPETTGKNPSRFLFPGIIAMGMVATGFGLGSLIASEPRVVGGSAVALGIGAVAVQWSLLIAGAVVLVLLVAGILSATGMIGA